MTADIRTAAQREAERAYDDRADDMSECCPDVQYGFERGAEWAVNRVTPTREQIERALIGRDFIAGTNAILALMAGLAEGESSG